MRERSEIMKKSILLILILACGLPLALAAQESIPGQRPMMLIKDTFKFVPGSWADYTILDKTKNEAYRMSIAALEEETYKGIPASWLEIEVQMKDMPVVVTKFLAEETEDGPGKVLKAIVQVEGYSPFTVPRKYLEGESQEVGQLEQAQIVKRLESKTIIHKGKKISVLSVEAEDSRGNTTAATVSLDLPPIAIYEAETGDIKMTLNDWGSGAKSKIQGTPISFTFWVIEQIAKGLVKK
jgi:hypothetical protein